MRIILFRKKDLIFSIVLLVLIIALLNMTSSLPKLVVNYSKIHKTVVIDAGHGSVDSGAHYNQLYEKDINLQIAYRLKKLLEKSNIKVVMTRTDDSLYNQSRKEDILYRVRKTKEANADAFISIHVNKFPSPKPFGGQAYYCRGEQSKLLAEKIQEQLRIIQPNNYRSIGRGEYFVLKKAEIPAVIVEVGFISNPVDRNRMVNPTEQEKIAKAIQTGLITFFNEQYEIGPEKADSSINSTKDPKCTEDLEWNGKFDLYFVAPNSETSLTPVQKIFSQSDIVAVNKGNNQALQEKLAKKAMEALIAGAESPNFISPIPPGTKLYSLQVQDRTAILDFNKALRENHWGGSEGE
ncbi:MAG: N-acetylmuramoyl-L-alanine amidase, partial [Desulfobacterales bacterium]|nr:N-acetylmuramoyl-L-alanine amidase [Desulfobacterales bacterium]